MQCGMPSSILAPPPARSLTLSQDNWNHLQTLPGIPGKAKHLPLKTTDLDKVDI